MGTWGVGVFDNDRAEDVKAGLLELLAAGFDSAAVTERLQAHLSLSDEEWIALAVAQWEVGRLADETRDRAIRAVDVELEAGPEPGRWSAEQWPARRSTLEEAKRQLLGQQRRRKRIKQEPLAQTPFSPGDMLYHRTAAGTEVVLWAISNKTQRGIVTEEHNTLWQLAAIGEQGRLAPEQIAAGPPPVLSHPTGSRFVVQPTLILPQDAVEPAWRLIGNVPFPEERIGFLQSLLFINDPPDDLSADDIIDGWLAAVQAPNEGADAVERLFAAVGETHAGPLPWLGPPTGQALALAAAVAHRPRPLDHAAVDELASVHRQLLKAGGPSERVARCFGDEIQRLADDRATTPTIQRIAEALSKAGGRA